MKNENTNNILKMIFKLIWSKYDLNNLPIDF